METKPAVHTTEFWFQVVAQVFFALNTTHAWLFMQPKWSGLAQVIILGAYTLSRGWAKSGVEADPNVPANFKLFPRRRDSHPRAR